MANTADTLQANQILEVTYTDSGADWNHDTNGLHPQGMQVKSIFWHPSAANDILVINEGGINGPSIVHAKADLDIAPQRFYFGAFGTRLKPYIDLSDCTFGTPANTKIIFILGP